MLTRELRLDDSDGSIQARSNEERGTSGVIILQHSRVHGRTNNMYTYSTHCATTSARKAASPSSKCQGNDHWARQMLNHRVVTGKLQAKLTVSDPADIHEQQADRVAEEIMQMAEPAPADSSAARVERKCPNCPDELERSALEEEEEKKVQTKSEANQTALVTPAVETSIRGLEGHGHPLSDSVRSFMEPRFGADFASVRVHTDPSAATLAREVNAHAFTVGHNIVFAAGRYEPQSDAGKRLLAHELSHVVQQGSAEVVDSGTDADRR